MNLGDAYWEHYERFLRGFTQRWSFEHDGASVQVLDFPHAMRDAHVYATIGLTHLQDQLKEVCEVVVPTSTGDELVSGAVGASLLLLLTLGTRISEASYLRHLNRTLPEFHERFGKSAMAFVEPYAFPDGFGRVPLGRQGRTGRVWMGFFISDAEAELAPSR